MNENKIILRRYSCIYKCKTNRNESKAKIRSNLENLRYYKFQPFLLFKSGPLDVVPSEMSITRTYWGAALDSN